MNESNNSTPLKVYVTISIIVTIAVILLAIILVPKGVPFWEFTASDIARLLIGLAIAALFIERSIEVIMAAWRGRGKQECKNRLVAERKRREKEAPGGQTKPSAEEIEAGKELEKWGAHTRVLALLTAFGLGIFISALGLRCLQPLLDPAVFKSLGGAQRGLFTGADTLITGALLGGGSDAIHKMLDTILSWFDKTRKRIKGEST